MKQKVPSWNSDLGIWYLVRTKHLTVHGTTPRNADAFTLDLDVGKFSFWPYIGRKRLGFDFWVDQDVKWSWEHWLDKKAESQWNNQFGRTNRNLLPLSKKREQLRSFFGRLRTKTD